jgi:hypothetical protein
MTLPRGPELSRSTLISRSLLTTSSMGRAAFTSFPASPMSSRGRRGGLGQDRVEQADLLLADQAG